MLSKAILAAALIGLGAVNVASAAPLPAIDLAIPDVTVTAPGTAHLDVKFSLIGGATGSAAGYDLVFYVQGPDNLVTFSGASEVGVVTGAFTSTTNTDWAPATRIWLSNQLGGAAGSANPITDGATLVHLDYNVAAGASGKYSIKWFTDSAADPLVSAVYDGNANTVPVTFVDGSITVSVPEPTTLALLGVAGMMLMRRKPR